MDFNPGTALVSQSLIINGSTAIDEKKIDGAFLIDLAVFVETIVLNNKLITIKSDKIPANILQLPSRQKLLQLGIIEEISDTFSNELENQVKLIKQIVTNQVSENDITFSKWLTKSYTSFLPNGEAMTDSTAELLDTRYLMEYLDVFHNHKEFQLFLSRTVDLWYHHSAPWQFWQRAFHLRTVMYLAIANHLSVPLAVDLTRSKILSAYSIGFNENLLHRAYQHVANSISASVEELKAWNTPFNVTIPPLLAIILSRSNKPQDIIRVVLDVREEFYGLRKAFNEYEIGIHSSKSLREAKEYQQRVIRICNELSKDYEKTYTRGFIETLDFVESAISAGADAANPASYSSKLITMPIDWISQWWTRRKAHQLFKLQKKVSDIENLSKLVKKVFNYELTADPWKLFENWKE